MTTYSVNRAAVDKATALIDAYQYVLESDWSEAQPTTDDENELIDRDGWETYGEWHLGLNDEHDDDHTKVRYGFCYGDFRRVHRQGLVGAIDRAAEWHHDAIESAARQLLEHLDAVHAGRDG